MGLLLFAMSLSGSVFFSLYIILSPLINKYCSVRWKYGILKAAIVLYLFPFPSFKYILKDIVSVLFPGLNLYHFNLGVPIISNSSKIMYIVENSFFFSEETKKMIYILLILSVFSIIIICFQLFSYYKLKYYVSRYAVNMIEDTLLLKQIDKIKRKLKLRQQVQVYESEYSDMPMVLGIFHLCILLPKKRLFLSEDEQEYILLHELFHVKHRDLVVKFLGLFVIAIHWFNPISYWLFYELCCMSEIYCDNQVAQTLDLKKRKEYGELLINMSTEDTLCDKLYVPVSLLGSTKKITKRRLKELKKQKTTYSKVLSFVLALMMCLMASVTVFAYEPAERIEISNAGDWTDGELSEITFYPGKITKVYLPYDSYFTDTTGKVYEVKSEADNRIVCVHKFIPGQLTKHTKNKNGGCKMQYFNAEYCTKCGNKRNLVCYNTETNTTCTH